jgi:hypothetical protein
MVVVIVLLIVVTVVIVMVAESTVFDILTDNLRYSMYIISFFK